MCHSDPILSMYCWLLIWVEFVRFFFTCYLLICLFVCFWPWSEEGPARPPTSTVALKQTNHRHPQLISINDITAAIEGGKAMLISLLPQGLLVWSFQFLSFQNYQAILSTIPYHIILYHSITYHPKPAFLTCHYQWHPLQTILSTTNNTKPYHIIPGLSTHRMYHITTDLASPKSELPN